LLSGSGGVETANAPSYHYLQDHLGSPIRLLGEGDYDSAAAYDEFGMSEIGHAQPTQPQQYNFINPFGFTGYQADDIPGLLYAQARYYTPSAGRFTAEDPIKDQRNWYGYCNANPISFVDPAGLFRSIPSGLSIGVTAADHFCMGQEGGGGGQESGGGGQESEGQPTTVRQNPPQEPLPPDPYQEIKPNVPKDIKPEPMRDVTDEVNRALRYTATEAFSRRVDPLFREAIFFGPKGIVIAAQRSPAFAANLVWFIELMDHGKPWDIKRPEPWGRTIGTDHPGSIDTSILFRGRIMTPESLGNWTYGYIGAALGLGLGVLLLGSWYADGFSAPWTYAFRRNEFLDWGYVALGFNAFNGIDYECD